MSGHDGRVGTCCWSSNANAHILCSGSRDRQILQRDVREVRNSRDVPFANPERIRSIRSRPEVSAAEVSSAEVSRARPMPPVPFSAFLGSCHVLGRLTRHPSWLRAVLRVARRRGTLRAGWWGISKKYAA